MGLFRWLLVKVAGMLGALPHQRVRKYRVTLFGEPLGTFTLPIGDHMANPTSSERPVLTRPFKVDMPFDDGSGFFYFYWAERYADGRFKVVTWHPDTRELRDEARRFFNAAHGLRPDGTPDPERQRPLPTRTAEETRLIRAALANWGDERLLLAYVDWLTAQGDAYGEYIRLTLEVERLPEKAPRRQQFEEQRQKIVFKDGPRWVLPLTDLGLYPGVHFGDYDHYYPDFWFGKRGVIEELDIPHDAPVFPVNAARLFYGAPFLRKLSVNNLDITVADVGTIPQMTQIESLALSIGAGTEDDCRRFAESPHLGGLRELKLSGVRLGPGGAAHLARAAWLANLRVLTLGNAEIGDEGAEALAGSPNVASLTSLSAGNNGLTSRGLLALAESPYLTRLESLDASGSYDPFNPGPRPGCSAEAIGALGRAAFAASLKSLSLDLNLTTPEAAAALAAAEFPALRRLSVGNYALGPVGLSAILRASWFRHLEAFAANAGEGGDTVAEVLDSLGFTELRELDLSGNRLTDTGATALIRSKAVTKLQKLSLARNPFGPAAVQALAGTDLPALEDLDLSDVPLGPAGAKALAASPHLKRLKKLYVSAEHVGLTGREALIRRFTEEVVTIYG